MNDTRPQPSWPTGRLVLRPFTLADADMVQVLLAEKRIAANTRTIEYPYPPGAALEWIEKHDSLWKTGRSAVFAVCRPQPAGSGVLTEQLIGAVGLEIQPGDENAELGYWIGAPYWNQGYASEAAASLVGFGFDSLGLHRLHASHMTRNPASGKVLRKIGFRREGCLRGHIKKWGIFEDVVVYGMLRRDWEQAGTGFAADKGGVD